MEFFCEKCNLTISPQIVKPGTLERYAAVGEKIFMCWKCYGIWKRHAENNTFVFLGNYKSPAIVQAMIADHNRNPKNLPELP